jgi:hypothetical protein
VTGSGDVGGLAAYFSDALTLDDDVTIYPRVCLHVVGVRNEL